MNTIKYLLIVAGIGMSGCLLGIEEQAPEQANVSSAANPTLLAIIDTIISKITELRESYHDLSHVKKFSDNLMVVITKLDDYISQVNNRTADVRRHIKSSADVEEKELLQKQLHELKKLRSQATLQWQKATQLRDIIDKDLVEKQQMLETKQSLVEIPTPASDHQSIVQESSVITTQQEMPAPFSYQQSYAPPMPQHHPMSQHQPIPQHQPVYQSIPHYQPVYQYQPVHQHPSVHQYQLVHQPISQSYYQQGQPQPIYYYQQPPQPVYYYQVPSAGQHPASLHQPIYQPVPQPYYQQPQPVYYYPVSPEQSQYYQSKNQ